MTSPSSWIRSGQGDSGTSSLGDEHTRSKTQDVFHALGAIDETQTALGVCRAHLVSGIAHAEEMRALLERCQHDCIAIGAVIAVIGRGERADTVRDRFEHLEVQLREWEQRIRSITGFVISGENVLSAEIDRARTVVRRSEREIVRFLGAHEHDGSVLGWLNVLSDLLFVLARYTESPPEG